MNLALIGCGLIGHKRLRALGKGDRLIGAADRVLERAQRVRQHFPGAVISRDWERIVSLPNLEAVIVATSNDWLAPVTLAAVEAGKHVLVEKPGARTAEELEPLIGASQQLGTHVHIGFNHRYHPAIRQAHEMVQSGRLGELMFLRGRYGHGGRLGYECEWRAHPEISGGGELIDQGVHLIDLARWFLGEFVQVEGRVHTYYWPMPVEDNAFLWLHTAERCTAWLHASCTEWKSLFSLEIYGRKGKLQVDGLGGSYGVERLSYYELPPELGPPRTTIWEYPGEDLSWRYELEDFARAVHEGKPPSVSLQDAKAALEIVQQVYRNNHCHDHHSLPIAHLFGRRRHRPAVLLS